VRDIQNWIIQKNSRGKQLSGVLHSVYVALIGPFRIRVPRIHKVVHPQLVRQKIQLLQAAGGNVVHGVPRTRVKSALGVLAGPLLGIFKAHPVFVTCVSFLSHLLLLSKFYYSSYGQVSKWTLFPHSKIILVVGNLKSKIQKVRPPK
jgi:hypothetical protein